MVDASSAEDLDKSVKVSKPAGHFEKEADEPNNRENKDEESEI